MTKHRIPYLFWIAVVSATVLGGATPRPAIAAWSLGTPIVSYWEGPGSLLSGKEAYGVLDDAAAKQLAAGGFNVVCAATIPEVRLAQSHGLRTMLQSTLFTAASLDGGPKQAQIDAIIDQYKVLPAAYSYHITDEPNASQFADLGRIVSYIRRRDPEHMAYINLLPNNASDEQLGSKGYPAHLGQFIRDVQPALLSYDHYQFHAKHDGPLYLQNLELVGQAAKRAGVPLLNTVQACSYHPSMRVPNDDETRFLVYTTLAYGAQGISFYHYASWGPEHGGIALPGGKPLPLFATLQTLNREFVAIAKQYQRLKWIGTYLKGYRADAMPPGTTALPSSGSPFNVSNMSDISYTAGAPLKGILLGFFDMDGAALSDATFAIVQNLDYSSPKTYRVTGPDKLSIFNATTGTWTPKEQNHADVTLPPGGGVLVGLTSVVPTKPND